MATDNNRLHLTDQEVLLERVMRDVVARVQDAGFILKGGGALVFAYGSHRHTTDLDFDAERKTDMTRRIRRAIQATGVEIDEGTWWWPKGGKATRDSIRYRVEFVDCQGKRQQLHVDTRYRPRPEFSNSVIVKGIRTYKPETLYSQKLVSLSARRAARDAFDLAFLSRKYGDTLTDDQVLRAERITRNMDKLERSIDKQLQHDTVLARITTAQDIVLEFREAIDAQFRQRSMKHPEQSVPISIPMMREIIALRRFLHGDESITPEKNQPSIRRPRSEIDRSDSGRSNSHRDWFDR